MRSEIMGPKEPIILSVALAENATKLSRTFQVHQW